MTLRTGNSQSPIIPNEDGVLMIEGTHLPLCTFLHLMRQGFDYKNLKTLYPQYDTSVFVGAMKYYLKHAEYLKPQLSRDAQNKRVVALTKRTLSDVWVWQLARWEAEEDAKAILSAMRTPAKWQWKHYP